MEDHCDAVKVNPVEQVVNSSWFLKALEGAYDAVVVAGTDPFNVLMFYCKLFDLL